MSYQRAYRLVGFGSIGFVVMVFSIALSRSLGLIGFMLPWLLIGTAYLVVSVIVDLIITWLAYKHPDTHIESD